MGSIYPRQVPVGVIWLCERGRLGVCVIEQWWLSPLGFASGEGPCFTDLVTFGVTHHFEHIEISLRCAIKPTHLTMAWHTKIQGTLQIMEISKKETQNHLLLLVSLIHGHLKTRLFAVKTSKNVGFGRPMVDNIYQISPRSRLGALSLPAEAAPVWWVVMSGASPVTKQVGSQKRSWHSKSMFLSWNLLCFFLCFYCFVLSKVCFNMLLSFPLPLTLRWFSISTQRWECWVGLVKPSNTEPLCGAWVVSLGFSRSFVLCFKWDPTWDRMTCVRVYFKVESSFCWKTAEMQISDSIVIVVSYLIRSNFRFALAVLKRKIFTAAASVQGGLSCSIKILASCVITCQKACLKSFNPTFDKVSTQPLTGKSHAGWDPCAGCSQADRHKDLVSHVAFKLPPRTIASLHSNL